MTYEQRKQQVCNECSSAICGYRSRGLADKCEYLQSVMMGWELGQKDSLGLTWHDAQGDDLPANGREVIVLVDCLKQYRVGGEERHAIEIDFAVYDGNWNVPDVKYWLDVELPKEEE